MQTKACDNVEIQEWTRNLLHNYSRNGILDLRQLKSFAYNILHHRLAVGSNTKGPCQSQDEYQGNRNNNTTSSLERLRGLHCAIYCMVKVTLCRAMNESNLISLTRLLLMLIVRRSTIYLQDG